MVDDIHGPGEMGLPYPEIVTEDPALSGDPGSVPEDVYSPEDDEKAKESESKIISKIEKMLHDGKRGKNVLQPQDADNVGRYTGDRVDDNRRALWATQIRYNPFKNTVDTELSIEADQDVSINIRGKGGPDSEVMASFCEAILRDHWTRSGMGEKRLSVRKWSSIVGTGVSMVLWREGDEKTPGRNQIEVIDPRMILFDPDSVTNEEFQATGWCIRFRWMTKEEVEKTWPVDYRGEPIKDRLKSVRPLSSRQEANTGYSDLPMDIFGADPTQQYAYDRELPDHYLVSEAWYRDDSVEEIPVIQINPETGAPELTGTERRPKYPTGRYTVVLLSSSTRVLLQDDPNKYDFFPIVVFPDTSDPSKLFGIPALKNVRWLGKLMNDVAGAIADSIKQCGYPRLKVNTLIGPNVRTITNMQGEIYQCKGTISDAIEYMNPPALVPDAWRLLEYATRWFQDSTGLFDAVVGRKPASVVAAKAIESLQQVALQRPRESVRAQMRGFELMGKMMLQNLVSFGGADPRWITLAGEKGKRLFNLIEAERMKVIQSQAMVNPEMEMTQDTGLPDFVSDRATTTPLGQEQPSSYHFQWIADRLQISDLELEIESGVSLAQSKVERAQQALELFALRDEHGLPPIDAEELLKLMDVPNREAILERIRAKGDAQAQLQQMAPRFQALVEQAKQSGLPLPWEQQAPAGGEQAPGEAA